MRRSPDLPVASRLYGFSWRGPKPTPRTQQFLRRYDLVKLVEKDPKLAVQWLITNESSVASDDQVFVLSELAFIAASVAEKKGNVDLALDYYGISVSNAYAYLMSDDLADARNPYDPRFRQASDLYNGALENTLRLVQKRGMLKPGSMLRVQTDKHEYEIHFDCRGPWRSEEIGELKFVSDFELRGLKNHYHTYGLGVPLIAVLNPESGTGPANRYYSPGVSFPATAFLQVAATNQLTEEGRTRHIGVLELYDPLSSTDIVVNDRLVPLETDLSTSLAYTLNDPRFKRANLALKGLLNSAESQQSQGLYLLEPYDPEKIPVLMIHGLYSNLNSWMEMFNDLRGTPEIRDNFQFWFYLYPTGQPFLLTAAQLRRDLAEAREALDPDQTTETLDEMILVGHSMGGLIARLQTLESGERFEPLAKEIPGGVQLASYHGDDGQLGDPFRFHPSNSIHRVVTIATPHQGSKFANGATQWLGRQLIRVPEVLMQSKDQLLNADVLGNRTENHALEIQTSIDALGPASPILEAMHEVPPAPWVMYHNIMGRVAEEGILAKVAKDSDGVVTLSSAHLDGAVSELVVEADHVNIHRHPKTILEVQRVLLSHLHERSRQE